MQKIFNAPSLRGILSHRGSLISLSGPFRKEFTRRPFRKYTPIATGCRLLAASMAAVGALVGAYDKCIYFFLVHLPSIHGEVLSQKRQGRDNRTTR